MTRHFLGFTALPLLALSTLAGCTGHSLGENEPGSNLGNYLGDGRVAVDPKTETSYVIVSKTDERTGAVTDQQLLAVKAGDTVARKVLDLADRDDPRLLFVSSGVMSMSQKGASEELVLFDRDSLLETKRALAPTWYWGTRISASGRWVGVADNQDADHDIHVIDASTLDVHVLPHGGDALEAMFANQSDRLIAVSFDTATHSARLRSWEMSALEAQGFAASPDGSWSGNDLDVGVEGVDPDAAFSFTWVGISPDDRLAVFPVRKYVPPPADPKQAQPPEPYELVVLDLESHETTVIPNAKGPVGFTPDGSTIVSYDDVEDGDGEQLMLIDARTFETDEEKVDISGGLSFFISHQNDVVVVASSWGDESLVLYDVDSHEQTKMTGPGVGLTEFVNRRSPEQLWIVESGTNSKTNQPFGDLYVADMKAATVDHVATPFEPEHLGILPKRDELVVTDIERRKLHFFDPDTREVLRDVPVSL
jgi:hypothetical protein